MGRVGDRSDQRGSGEPADSGGKALPLRAILPGLLAVALFDLYGLLSSENPPVVLSIAVNVLMLTLPWITILAFKARMNSIGISRRDWLKNIGWGTLAGLLWRAASLLSNLALLQLSGLVSMNWTWLPIMVVPWVEEIFFRGYLGFALSDRCGRGPGNLLQASLFTLQPAHVAQGFPGLVSIFIFGLGVGWLVQRRGSVWIGVAAHAAANAILLPLAGFA